MANISSMNQNATESMVESPKAIKQLKTVIVFLSVLVLVVLAILIYFIYQRGIAPTPRPSLQEKLPANVQISAMPTKSLPAESNNPTCQIDWKSKLILSKDYGNFKIGAFALGEVLGDVFIVAPIENELPTTYFNSYALSFAQDAFETDNLFDVAGDKIYILNQGRSFIDVYTASFSEATRATPAIYQMNYIDSINGPKYKVGVPYSIKCQNNLCQVKTGISQESGCDMDLNLETKQYSRIKCSGIGGEFSPQPL